MLNGCYLHQKVTENQYLTVTNIEIYNQDNVMLETELCSSDDIFLFDLSDNFKENKNLTTPTMSPISYIYATKFNNVEKLYIVIYAERKGQVIINNISINSIDSEYNKVNDNYISKNIEYDGNNVKITFLIMAPEIQTKYSIGLINLDINNIKKPGFLKSPNNDDQAYFSVFLANENAETEDEIVIKRVNNFLNTEYKMLSMVTNVIEDINNKVYSYDLTCYNNWIFDAKYKDLELEYDDFYKYQQVYYQYQSYYDRVYNRFEYYITDIYCNAKGYSVFGLSVESTIEEVMMKMEEIGAKRYYGYSTDTGELYLYKLKNNHEVEINFKYNLIDKKIEYFSISLVSIDFISGIYSKH